MKSRHCFCCASESGVQWLLGDAIGVSMPAWQIPDETGLLSTWMNVCIGSLHTELISRMDFVVWQWICISYPKLASFLECDDSLCRYLTLGFAASRILIQQHVYQYGWCCLLLLLTGTERNITSQLQWEGKAGQVSTLCCVSKIICNSLHYSLCMSLFIDNWLLLIYL